MSFMEKMSKLDTKRPVVAQATIDKYRKVKPLDLSKETPLLATNVVTRKALNTGLDQYTGTWNKDATLHLLRRILFGVKKSELDLFSNMPFSNAISTLLSESAAPDVPVNDYNDASEGIEDPNIPFGETWIEAPYGFDFEGQRVISLKSWLVNNIINQESNITEKLVLFWHNLLVTESYGVFIGKASYQYFKVLRDNAFGNFKTMIKQITLDPAVLYYLNGNSNIAESPDENYARELQELFCLGKGENSLYTEGDVQAAARILTGWGANWEDVLAEGVVGPTFRFWNHDTSDKQFSSFYDNKVIEGKSGMSGGDEVDELLDMIFETNEVALYICRRLYNFFVYNEIDAATEANVIEPLANIFRSSNYEIRPVIEALFNSEHFHDTENHSVMLKNPADHLLGAWRSFEMQDDDPNDIFKISRTNIAMVWRMSGMGMELADPPSVAGWPAYYQAPQFDRSWITTDTITSRASYIDQMIFGWFWTADGRSLKADLIGFISQFENPELPGPMIEEAANLLLGLTLSSEAVDRLKAILLTGQSTDSYWTGAWLDHINDPTNQEFKLIVEQRLQGTFQSMLQLGEFQLM